MSGELSKPVPKRWRNEYEVFWQPDSKVRQVLEELGAAEVQLAAVTEELARVKLTFNQVVNMRVSDELKLYVAKTAEVTQQRDALQKRLGEVTERWDTHACMDDCNVEQELAYKDMQIAALQAQLALITEERDEWKKVAEGFRADLLDRVEKREAAERKAQLLQARNKELLDALRDAEKELSRAEYEEYNPDAGVRLRISAAIAKSKEPAQAPTAEQPPPPEGPGLWREWTFETAFEQLELCGYECEGGALKNNIAYMWLKSHTAAVTQERDRHACNAVELMRQRDELQVENRGLLGLDREIEDSVDALQDRNKTLVEIVRRLEWSARGAEDNRSCCPVCGGRRWQHGLSCDIRKALAQPKEPAAVTDEYAVYRQEAKLSFRKDHNKILALQARNKELLDSLKEANLELTKLHPSLHPGLGRILLIVRGALLPSAEASPIQEPEK